MTHPDDALLLARVDDELPEADADAVDAHVLQCEACFGRLIELRRSGAMLAVALADVDRTEPAAWSSPESTPQLHDMAPRRRALRQSSGATSIASKRHQGAATSSNRMAWRIAALVLLSVSGVASAAIVLRGSPRSVLPPEPSAVAAQSETTPPPTPASAPAGAIVVAPDAGEMLVQLREPGAGSRVVISTADRVDVLVNVERVTTGVDGDSAAAHFSAREGEVRVQLSGRRALVRVEVPRGLRHARVVVGERTLAVVSAGTVNPPEAATAPGIAVPDAR